MKHSSQQEIAQLQREHTERVEAMEAQMRNKERFLAEHKKFVQVNNNQYMHELYYENALLGKHIPIVSCIDKK